SSGSGGSATASSGCGKAVSVTGAQMGMVEVGGATRTYLYEIPTGYSVDEPIPLTFGFHGASGDVTQAQSWGVDAAATAAGDKSIFVFPQGVSQGGTIGWDTNKSGDDVALFDALLDWAETTFCIDAHRVYLVGFSWGTDFANALGC